MDIDLRMVPIISSDLIKEKEMNHGKYWIAGSLANHQIGQKFVYESLA